MSEAKQPSDAAPPEQELPEGTQTAEAEAAEEPEAQPGNPSRRILAGLFWLLASIAILVSGVTLWAHQTLLTSDGWTRVVADVAADPEVIENTSAVVVSRLSESLGVQDKVADILPDALDGLAGAITTGLEDRVAASLADLAATEKAQDAFLNVNRAAHDAAMTTIRGPESEALSSQEGTISLNVFPLIERGLVALQENGIISEDRQIPDLSEYEPPEQTVARLETLLGRELPDDIGTITLIESERLDRVQTAVRNFDIITLVLILLAVACVALALWLSARRVRMVLWLAIGAVAALALGRGFTRLIIEDISGALRSAEAGVVVQSVIDSAVDSLMWFTFAIIVLALIIAGLALWYERRGRPELAVEAAEPLSVSEYLREHSRTILYAGLAIIGFLALWNVGGPDIALLTGAAVGILLIAYSLLAGDGPASAEAPSEGGGG